MTIATSRILDKYTDHHSCEAFIKKAISQRLACGTRAYGDILVFTQQASFTVSLSEYPNQCSIFTLDCGSVVLNAAEYFLLSHALLANNATYYWDCRYFDDVEAAAPITDGEQCFGNSTERAAILGDANGAFMFRFASSFVPIPTVCLPLVSHVYDVCVIFVDSEGVLCDVLRHFIVFRFHLRRFGVCHAYYHLLRCVELLRFKIVFYLEMVAEKPTNT